MLLPQRFLRLWFIDHFDVELLKAGQQSLCQSLGESVSLTQLECLPFHLQLEVANGQHDYDSSVRPISSKVQPKALFRLSDHSKSGELGTSDHSTTNKSRFETKENDTEEKQYPTKMIVSSQSRRALFREDIVPLQAFMDDHTPEDDTALWSVVQFLLL